MYIPVDWKTKSQLISWKRRWRIPSFIWEISQHQKENNEVNIMRDLSRQKDYNEVCEECLPMHIYMDTGINMVSDTIVECNMYYITSILKIE